MNHQQVTADVVARVEQLLAEGIDTATIAERVGLSLYVVETIAGQKDALGESLPTESSKKRIFNSQKRIDTGTILHIQRMLSSGSDNYSEIARELGLSRTTVGRVATGRRQTLSVCKASLAPGERALPKPIRCKRCRALVHILPCRACFTKLMKRLRKKHQKNKIFRAILKKRFNVFELFVLLVGTFNHLLGGPTMPDLMPFLSTEISALLSNTDKREAVIAFAEKLFDQVITRIDLPGPDTVIDPILRAAIRPLVGRIYDRVLQKLEVNAHA